MELRPYGIGELIDRSVNVWRRNFWPLFRLYLVFQLLIFILTKGYELSMYRWFPLLANRFALTQALQEGSPEAARQGAMGGVLTAVLMAVGIWSGWMIGVAGTHYLYGQLTGAPSSVREALRRMWQRAGTTTLAFLLSSVWALLVAALCLAPGAALMAYGLSQAGAPDSSTPVVLLLVGGGGLLAVFGILAASVWYVLRFVLTPQVIAIEGPSALGALRRSGELVSGRVGPKLIDRVKIRATLLLTIVFAILFVVGVITGAPAVIIQLVYSQGADGGTIPQGIYVPAQLLQVFGQAVFSPLYLVFGALFYVDMRVRREGLDLELQLRKP